MYMQPTSSRMCDICGVPAREFCCDCSQYFCDSCKAHHLKIRSLQGHRFKPYIIPADDRVAPPSYQDVVHSDSIQTQDSANIATNNVERNKKSVDVYSEELRYICIECDLPVLHKDDRLHYQHTIIDITGDGTSEDVSRLLKLLPQSSTDIQTTIIRILKRFLEKGSSLALKSRDTFELTSVLTGVLCTNHDLVLLEAITSLLVVIPFENFNERIILDISEVLVNKVIQPDLISIQHVSQPVYVNAIRILRKFSDIEPVIKHLRQCRDLVNSLIRTVRIYMTEIDGEDSQCVEHCMCALYNLSDDVIDETERDDYGKPEVQPLFKQLFTKKKKKSPKESVSVRPPVPGMTLEYEGLWSDVTITSILQVLLNASNTVTLQSTMNLLVNLMPFEWHGGHNIRTWIRKQKGLPVIVDLLGHTDQLVIYSACKLVYCLIFDDVNKHLLGLYAMKQLLSLIPLDMTSIRPLDETVLVVLNTLIEITEDKDKKNLLMESGGLDRIKYIKFTPKIYSEEVKERSCELLSSLWKYKKAAAQYGLTESEVKAHYVI